MAKTFLTSMLLSLVHQSKADEYIDFRSCVHQTLLASKQSCPQEHECPLDCKNAMWTSILELSECCPRGPEGRQCRSSVKTQMVPQLYIKAELDHRCEGGLEMAEQHLSAVGPAASLNLLGTQEVGRFRSCVTGKLEKSSGACGPQLRKAVGVASECCPDGRVGNDCRQLVSDHMVYLFFRAGEDEDMCNEGFYNSFVLLLVASMTREKRPNSFTSFGTEEMTLAFASAVAGALLSGLVVLTLSRRRQRQPSEFTAALL